MWTQFFLENHWKLYLITHTTFKSHWNLFLVIISRLEMASFCYNISLKFWSERFKMAVLLLPGVVPSNTEFSRNLIFRQDCDVFARIWCHYMGIPCQNWGNPLEIAIFSRFHLVMCIPITKLYLMTAVLLKTSLKYRFHPLAPLPHPPCPSPLAPPHLPPPLALFPQPFSRQFGPPCQK